MKIDVIVLLQFSIIFIDSEGTPIQELSALEMDFNTREIIDVFHGYAYTTENDSFARKHIHGLNTDFLLQNGYENMSSLITAFKVWLRERKHFMFYANDPGKEMQVLKMYMTDIGLDKWINRIHKPYHHVAFYFKKRNIPILSKHCCAEAHSSYQNAYVRPFNKSDIAREQSGYHCSLYDCYEMYLCYVTTE